MRRREVISFIGGAAAWPLTARAQQPLPVIGIIGPGTADTNAMITMVGLREGLKEGGYIEGQNLVIEYRHAEGRNDRMPALAADLVRRQVKVIYAGGTPSVLAAKAATTTIPIVFQVGADPVKIGLVASFNRPGGNLTGVSNASATLAAKRLELLHRLAPGTTTIGVLVDPTSGPVSEIQTADLREAAAGLGLQLLFLNTSNEQEIDAAFTTLVQKRIGALLLTDTPLFNTRREQLVTLARFNAIPTMYTFRQFAVSGGLISYASSITDSARRAGVYVARILKGERAGDLPVQLPTKFELVINLRTAKALGINVPSSLLALADDVIE